MVFLLFLWTREQSFLAEGRSPGAGIHMCISLYIHTALGSAPESPYSGKTQQIALLKLQCCCPSKHACFPPSCVLLPLLSHKSSHPTIQYLYGQCTGRLWKKVLSIFDSKSPAVLWLWRGQRPQEMILAPVSFPSCTRRCISSSVQSRVSRRMWNIHFSKAHCPFPLDTEGLEYATDWNIYGCCAMTAQFKNESTIWICLNTGFWMNHWGQIPQTLVHVLVTKECRWDLGLDVAAWSHLSAVAFGHLFEAGRKPFPNLSVFFGADPKEGHISAFFVSYREGLSSTHLWKWNKVNNSKMPGAPVWFMARRVLDTPGQAPSSHHLPPPLYLQLLLHLLRSLILQMYVSANTAAH